MSPSPDRIPVIVGVGQSIHRGGAITSRDLMETAAQAALAEAPLLDRIERITTVDVINDPFAQPATALARRLGLDGVICETTVVGGNTPQLLITRAAEMIANGEMQTTLLAGSEALAAAKLGPVDPDPDAAVAGLDPDPVLGTDKMGFGEAEHSIRLWLPIHIYPMFESVMAAEAGRTFAEQRAFISQFMSRNSSVAAKHPFSWFPVERSADELATVTDDNRLIAEPYTKFLNSIMAVNQGAALVITSLEVARQAGLADQAVFIWSGADCNDVWFPVQRPHLGRSPAIGAAGSAALGAAAIGIDDIEHLDFYSCFPAAVEAAATEFGVALDDPRGLTVTGGLAYFGGPGNNYPMNAVATSVDRLRESGSHALCTGLGWFTTKHSVGIYGANPPPDGFRRGVTTEAQQAIDDSALPVTLDASGSATVVANTVTYERDGSVGTAPVFADLPDGRRVAASAHPDEMASLAGRCLVGETIQLEGSRPLTYRVG